MNLSPLKKGTYKGFTLIEALVVISIMAIVMAMAVPSFIDWQSNLEYRQAARSVMSLLRNARSQAITTNSNQWVVVETMNNRAGISTNGMIIWTTFPASIAVGSSLPTTTFQFVPNGTVSTGTGTVVIDDNSGSTRFLVLIDQTGRIRIKKP